MFSGASNFAVVAAGAATVTFGGVGSRVAVAGIGFAWRTGRSSGLAMPE